MHSVLGLRLCVRAALQKVSGTAAFGQHEATGSLLGAMALVGVPGQRLNLTGVPGEPGPTLAPQRGAEAVICVPADVCAAGANVGGHSRGLSSVPSAPLHCATLRIGAVGVTKQRVRALYRHARVLRSVGKPQRSLRTRVKSQFCGNRERSFTFAALFASSPVRRLLTRTSGVGQLISLAMGIQSVKT